MGPGSALAVASLVAIAVLGACTPDPRWLRALPGCGRDLELESVRVTARGDFAAAPVVLGVDGELPDWPAGTQGLTVEGLLGEDTVDAVGRTARMLSAAGAWPVYFAPPDTACAVTSGRPFREDAAVVVGDAGDLVIIGGRSAAGELVGEILRGSDDAATIERLAADLPVPSVGQAVVPAADGTFWVFGGAGPSGTVVSTVHVDPRRTGAGAVGDPVVLVLEGEPSPRAFAAVARLDDDTALLVGGCRTTLAGACDPMTDDALDEVVRVDTSVTPPRLDREPALGRPRAGAIAHVAADGTVLVAGGVGPGGVPEHHVEWRDREGVWHDLLTDPVGRLGGGLDAVHVVAATWIDPGITFELLDDGRALSQSSAGIRWVDELRADAGAPSGRRTLLTLPGERLLVDDRIVPVLGLGVDLVADQGGGTDPGAVVRLWEVVPGPRRRGAVARLAADGSVWLVGGRDPLTDNPVSGPLVLRLRPPLDGPDERTPALRPPGPGALLHETPATLDLEGAVALDALPAGSDGFALATLRPRGFRGGALRLGAELEVVGGARPRIVLLRGARERVEIELLPAGLRARRRNAAGTVVELPCSGAPFPGGTGGRVRLDLTLADGRVDVELGSESGSCDQVGAGPHAVGFAAVGGDGAVRIAELVLARLPAP